MISTPIFVNSLVVFVRLYWFEKRFQHVVSEARSLRRTRSRTRSQPKDDEDVEKRERGVEGRNIVVLHKGGTKAASGIGLEKLEGPERKLSSLAQEELAAQLRDRPGQLPPLRAPSFHRDVTFADEVEGEEDLHSRPHRLPQRLNSEQHIAFLENQRNPKDKGILRIPGPREFDRGDVPIPLDLNDTSEPIDQVTSQAEIREPSGILPLKRNITIEEPDHPRPRSASGAAFSKLSQKKTYNSDQIKHITPIEDGGSVSRTKSRPGTSGSLRPWNSKDKESMPYLSWEPTIGRNSAFVDLTEEQREELGGIEYRSLKTLAIVLVGE